MKVIIHLKNGKNKVCRMDEQKKEIIRFYVANGFKSVFAKGYTIHNKI